MAPVSATSVDISRLIRMASEVDNEYTKLSVEKTSLKDQLDKALCDNVQLRAQVGNLKERMYHLGEAQKRFYISARAMNDGYKILQQIKPMDASPLNGTFGAIVCHHPSSAVVPNNNNNVPSSTNNIAPPQQNQKKRKADETTIPIPTDKVPKKNLNQDFAKTTTTTTGGRGGGKAVATAAAAIPANGGKSTAPTKSVDSSATDMPRHKLKVTKKGGREGVKDGEGSRPDWTLGSDVV